MLSMDCTGRTMMSRGKLSLEQRLLDLIERTGYEIVQSNGQRVFGPCPEWPPHESPPRQAEVFVGRLPRDCFEDELVPLFSRIGRIYMLRLMMDFSGTNRGFAFVTYTNSRDARMAIELLDNYEIRPNHRIGVVQSVDNCRLFIGNLPPNLTRKQVIDVLSSVTQGVVSAVLHYNRTDDDIRGFAFIEYKTHRDAAMARRKLLPEGTYKLFGTELTIDWAIPEPSGEQQVMANVTVLFVRYLSTYATDDMIRDFFSLNNQLEVVRVKRIKNYAFVHYEDRMSAELALNRISALDLTDCSLTETGGQPIEVKWSIPPEAVRQDKGYQSRSHHSLHPIRKQIGQPINSSSLPSNSARLSNFPNQHFEPSPVREINSSANPNVDTPKGLVMFWSNGTNWDRHWINKSRHPRPGLR